MDRRKKSQPIGCGTIGVDGDVANDMSVAVERSAKHAIDGSRCQGCASQIDVGGQRIVPTNESVVVTELPEILRSGDHEGIGCGARACQGGDRDGWRQRAIARLPGQAGTVSLRDGPDVVGSVVLVADKVESGEGCRLNELPCIEGFANPVVRTAEKVEEAVAESARIGFSAKSAKIRRYYSVYCSTCIAPDNSSRTVAA
jgi:hypothetical protein